MGSKRPSVHTRMATNEKCRPQTSAGECHARLKLVFADKKTIDHVDDPIHKDLSAAARHGASLFVCCDETAGIDRLGPLDSGVYGRHAHFNLGEMVKLPDGPDGEMDIEGLDVDGDWLWIVGSHALKRSKPRHGDGPASALRRMAKIRRNPNRAFLARVPLRVGDGRPRPVARDGERRIAHLKLSRNDSRLKQWLRGDRHIGPYLDLPSKENGLDIEGIVARGLRVWLGLRGPVLRQTAVVLELAFRLTRSGYLKARRIDGRRRYRKHLIPTGGRGVRDLAFDGDDLLVLTGPVTAGGGDSRILRWHDAASYTRSGVIPEHAVDSVIELPHRGEHDHPEGLVRWTGERQWLVVYDRPARERLAREPTGVLADIWRL